MAKRRTGYIFMAPHAISRWRARARSTKKISAVRDKIKRRLSVEIQKGVRMTKRGALQIEIEPGIWAICCPSFMGGWEVVTVIREGAVEDMEEKAKYLVRDNGHLVARAVITNSAMKPGMNSLRNRSGGDVRKELASFIPGEKVVILPEAYYMALAREV